MLHESSLQILSRIEGRVTVIVVVALSLAPRICFANPDTGLFYILISSDFINGTGPSKTEDMLFDKYKQILLVTSNSLVEEHIYSGTTYSTERLSTSPGLYLKTLKTDHPGTISLLNTGIGQIEACRSLTMALTLKSFDLVIAIGFAGGLRANLKIGDIFVASEIVQHDFKWVGNSKEQLIPPKKHGNFRSDFQELPQLVVDFNLATEAYRILSIEKNLSVHQGLLLSGNEFIANPNRCSEIIKQFPNGSAIDMESSALAQVARSFDCSFLPLKVISGKVTPSNHDISHQFFQYQTAVAGQVHALYRNFFFKNVQQRQDLHKISTIS